MARFLSGASGDAPRGEQPVPPVVPAGGGILDLLPAPPALPACLSEADLDVYVADFARTGFTGGLNWYRAIELSWELMAPWQGAVVTPPALFLAGERDLVVHFPGMAQLLPNLKRFAPNLTRTVLVPGAGHWLQQERPAEVNTALLAFLNGLPT
jgi:epoxide hydrolase A/B